MNAFAPGQQRIGERERFGRAAGVVGDAVAHAPDDVVACFRIGRLGEHEAFDDCLSQLQIAREIGIDGGKAQQLCGIIRPDVAVRTHRAGTGGHFAHGIGVCTFERIGGARGRDRRAVQRERECEDEGEPAG